MNFYFGRATGVFLKTLPFVALRIAVGVLFGIVTIVYFGIVGWLAFRLLSAGGTSAVIGAVGLLIATGLFLAGMRLARRYLLYMVAAGHIAVIAHIVDTGEAPANQIRYGTQQVKDHFAEASGLFVVDQLVKSVIKQFNNRAISFTNLVNFVPSLGKILTILRESIALAASYIDEAILAHMFLTEEENNWRAARDGLVLYGKTWKPVLGSTIIIVLGLYAVAFAVFLALTPVANLLGGLSVVFETLSWVIVLGMTVTVYLGFLKPWVKTVVITTFLLESAEMSPDSETMDFIADRSEKFRELTAKADAGDEAEQPVDAPASDFVDERPT